jgi:hypothetical protein
VVRRARPAGGQPAGTAPGLPAYTNRSRGWRISARQTWIRWRWGDETRYDVDRRLLQRADDVRPAEQHGN